MTNLQVLLIEDFESDALLAVRALGKAGFAVQHERVDSAEGLREALEQGKWDVIISDFSVPGFGALPALEIVRQSGRRIPVFVISSRAGEEAAVAVIKAGARDYLRKDHLSQLGERVRQELSSDQRLSLEGGDLRDALENVISESDKLLHSALPKGLLHDHARRLRDASSQALAALDRQ